MDADTLAIVGALALLVQCGHALHAMGAARARNVAAVAGRSLIAMAVAVLATYLAGQTLIWWFRTDVAFAWDGAEVGRAPIEGPGVFFSSARSFLSVLPIALLPAALLNAATSERARVRGLAVATIALTAVALPLLTAAGWVLLSRLDQPRANGSYAASASLSAVTRVWPAVVGHLLAASAGLTLAAVLGPRAGKYNRDGSANSIPAHSLPTMMAGDLLLFIGLPMLAAALAGDAAARVVNAVLAASAATLAASAVCSLRAGRIDVPLAWAAAVAGLVAGSLSAGSHPSIALALGAAAGLVLPTLSLKLDLRLRVDDPSGLCVPHLLGGLLGLVGATLGATLEGRADLLHDLLLTSIGVAGGIAAIVATAIATLAIGGALRKAKWLRVDAATESEGLDLAQHDVNAYPDFQQTLIKSYHLRQ